MVDITQNPSNKKMTNKEKRSWNKWDIMLCVLQMKRSYMTKSLLLNK